MPQGYKDYYAILGVSRDATQEEIKRAFKRLAKEWHPDLNPHRRKEAEERFKEIAEAYQVLSDPEKRRMYDLYGRVDVQPAVSSWSDFGAYDPFSELFDIFDSFFGVGTRSSRRERRTERGEDVTVELFMTLEEAHNGATKEIQVPLLVTCSNCGGTGAERGKMRVCTECGGSGRVTYSQTSFGGFVRSVTTITCPSCGGSGRVVDDICKRCGGTGRERETQTVTVEIPPGVEDGMELRLPGHGNAGRYGGQRGDLYIQIRLLPHERFQRKGKDLYTEVTITFPQAALGDVLTIHTLDGDVELVIPPGTQPNEVLRIPHKGMPDLKGKGKGDLYVTVKVDVPKQLTQQQRKLLLELAESMNVRPKGADKSFFERLKGAFGQRK
ncbi:MAG: hypothetical protein GDYSWBUE_001283 [Candidatus Fervidibacterota bacterium]